MPKIKVLNQKTEIDVEPGANLRSALQANKIPVHHGVGNLATRISQVLNCHGFGMCGTCKVYVKKGMENCSPKGLHEKLRLLPMFSAIGHDHEIRLACQTQVNGDIEIETQPNFNLYGEKFWGP